MPDGTLHILVFYFLAALTLGSAGVVALSKNIIYSTIALLGTFLGMAGMYIQLSADFLAAVQILVYVGGTLTLLLFAVMLTSQIDNIRSSNTSRGRWAAFIGIGFLLLILGKVATSRQWKPLDDPYQPLAMPSTVKLGHAFLSEYMLPFEVASVVLLGAMIGAVVLARRAVKRPSQKGH